LQCVVIFEKIEIILRSFEYESKFFLKSKYTAEFYKTRGQLEWAEIGSPAKWVVTFSFILD